MKTVEIKYPLRLVRKTDEPLTQSDWKKIFELPFDEGCRWQLNQLCKKNNEPNPYISRGRAINEIFIRAEVSYRVMPARYSSARNRTSLHKIYKTVPRTPRANPS
jgi:hypothetical protein